ncbi:rna polymerase ii transcription factor b subunit 4 [Ophiostoma piceae UAMH 11346]|uniref:General transcription and DNA repair factor IIH subunit TFB4 n=1 Tax=Ophiostoma piceae (strain UAMH 11346) TaxID=1262450 RepID=S3C639_OPHP1|nr:rna polymerase ii transcription factor b subunit 4 [Ophiostoma piceae UAMH 11346]
MDAVDASAHYEVSAAAETPALLTIVLDTNPRAWAALANTLPLSKAIANILVFANSHLALGSTNQVAVIASHSNRAVWLYPSPKEVAATAAEAAAKAKAARQKSTHTSTTEDDVVMEDAHSSGQSKSPLPGSGTSGSASKFPQFREIETTVLKSIHDLVTNTTERDLEETTTLLSGALTLALSHINKTAILIPAAAASKDGKSGGSGGATVGTSAGPAAKGGGGGDGKKSESDETGLHARILVISVSDSSPAQYIPTMNAVFAAAHAGVAIDVLALRGAATFLQQAAYITRGTFLSPPPASAADPHLNTLHTQGLLAYLMLGFSAASARDVANALVAPSADAVDFRAACFCHRRVVDTGFVCSICLSIFCEVPEAPASEPGASSSGPPMSECLTCGSQLRLGNYGAKPAVVPRPKKKKKKRLGVPGREETGSTVGTPMA